jgi:diguanylate cyclase (GGDEF)-like protein
MKFITRVTAWLDRQSPVVAVAAAAVILTVIWEIDYAAPPEITFGLFYLIPLFITAWFAGRGTAVAMSVISSLAWLTADEFPRGIPLFSWYMLWNFLIKLTAFIVASLAIYRLRKDYDFQKRLAFHDTLTGAANRRAFLEALRRETARARRLNHPLTLAYVDVDNFKQVNDSMGHDAGDAVLLFVADLLVKNLRAMDLVARIGGDEFAVLLPELNPEGARVVMEKIHKLLAEGAQEKKWPVSLSIGVKTYLKPSFSEAQMLHQADELMYGVKKSGKNAVSSAIEI